LYAQFLKKLTGGIVALVLKKQDSHCRLLRTLARELLACAVLRPVLNFASPGYVCCRAVTLFTNFIALCCED
jgi:sorting nexin-13